MKDRGEPAEQMLRSHLNDWREQDFEDASWQFYNNNKRKSVVEKCRWMKITQENV